MFPDQSDELLNNWTRCKNNLVEISANASFLNSDIFDEDLTGKYRDIIWGAQTPENQIPDSIGILNILS